MKRIVVMIVAVSFVVAAGIGVYQKQFYTDINDWEDRMDYFQVAVISKDLVESTISRMEEELDNSRNIWLVKACGEVEYDFQIRKQLVEIEKVYKGEDAAEGDKVNVTYSGLVTYFEIMAMNTGFVNFLQEGKEYLIFLEGEIAGPWKEPYRVFEFNDYLILPVFCLERMEERVPVTLEDEYSVDYAEVAGNEFFFKEAESFSMMNEWKAKLLERYVD